MKRFTEAEKRELKEKIQEVCDDRTDRIYKAAKQARISSTIAFMLLLFWIGSMGGNPWMGFALALTIGIYLVGSIIS